MKKKINKIIKYIILILCLVICFLSIYINRNFNNISFEQLLNTIGNGKGTSFSAMQEGLIVVGGGTLISLALVKLVLKLITKVKPIVLTFKLKNKVITFAILKRTNLKDYILLIIFIIFSIFFSFKLLNIGKFVKNQILTTKLFDEYYIDPNNVDIEFPEEKQNLIYIFVESLENSNLTIENGGTVNKSYTPYLEKTALSNLNFSNTNVIGGAYPVANTTWTVAAMIAQTSGLPLKVGFDYNNYSGFGESLPGAISIGDILEKNGYKNYLMMGSDASFGGRRDYFSYHGNYEIYDYVYAKKEGLIPNDYKVWWGYEDSKLFEYAKTKLLEISKHDEPFNFTLLTADTHFVDGYLDDICPTEFKSQYANVFNCADVMIVNFINWIKKQDFYDNTTIIITGDHLTMQGGFYTIEEGYQRTIYNTFINSKVKTTNSKNRVFSTLDMYPTTLASLGVTIENNRLGLGTNLFSNVKTIPEEIGIKKFSSELEKKSKFYNKNILGNTYYQMKEKVSGD